MEETLDSRFHGNDVRDGMSHLYALSKSASSRQLSNPSPCRRGLFSYCAFLQPRIKTIV